MIIISFVCFVAHAGKLMYKSEREQPAGYEKQQYSLSLSDEPIFLLLLPFVIGWNEKLE